MNRVSRAIQHGAAVVRRRLSLAPVGMLVALVLVVAAAALAVLATAPGHELARRAALGMLQGSVNGRVAVGSLGGTLWRALAVEDLLLADSAGQPVIRAEEVRARYALVDLLRGRYAASRIDLIRPVVILEQGPDGWNVSRLFRSGAPGDGKRGRRPLVELSNVRIVDGTLIVRRLKGGATDERRVLGINATLARLRLSHPESSAILASIDNLGARLAEPSLALVGAEGNVAVDGDSARIDLTRVELPGSRGAVAARLRWAGGFSADVAVSAQRLVLRDLAALDPRVPREGGGSIAVRLGVSASGGATVDVRELSVSSGASTVAGRIRFTAGPGGGFSIGDMALDLDPLDLSLLRPVLGKEVPDGLVRGTLAGSGTMADLMVEARVAFTDIAAAGRPVNLVNGRGRLTLGGREQLVFRGFSLSGTSVDFATVRRYAPAVGLPGRLGLEGTLNGPWRDARFEGSLSHVLLPYPSTRLSGRARLTMRDTVAVDANLRADALSLDLLAASYPAVALRGVVSGSLHVVGPLDALGFNVELAGPSGALTARGTVGTGDSLVAVRAGGTLAGVDLSAQGDGLPTTSLGGEWSVQVAVPLGDSAGPALGAARVALRNSRLAGARLSSAGLAVTLSPDRITVDTGYAEWPGGTLQVFGALGRAGRPPGQLSVRARADTLSRLLPVAQWLSRAAGDTGVVALDGGGQLTGTLVGTTAAWELLGSFDVAGARAFGFRVIDVRGEGRIAHDARGYSLGMGASLDSLGVLGLSYGPVGLGAAGRLDSLVLRVSAGFALGSAVQARLAIKGGPPLTRIALDTLVLDLPSSSWRLAAPAEVSITPESLWTDSLVLRSPAGRIFAAGSLPLGAVGDFAVLADSVPLGDLYTLAQRDTTGVGGLADFSVRLAGSAESPSLEARVGLSSGRFGEFRAPRLDALASYADRRLSFKGGLWREGARVVAFGGRLPVDLALSGASRRLLPDSILLSARSDSVDLSVVDALTALVTNVGGSVDGEVRMEGTFDEPRLAGFVEVHRGSVSVPSLGARYGGIEARLELEGDRIRVARARLVSGGTLDVLGEVRLPRGGSRPELDLVMEANGFDALSLRDFAGVTGSGQLTVKGPLLGATLSGRLTVDAGFLAFANLVEKRIVSLDDPEFQAIVDSNLARAAGLGPEFQIVFLDSLRIDSLGIEMGPDFWLRSSEANIQLAGGFRVAKAPEGGVARYRMDGTLRAVRGTYRLELVPVSREFRVTRGTVRFFGTPDLNPELDIAAEHQVRTLAGSQLVVRALIGGSLLQPKLTLESDQRPPLSETDIVSYLLFGRPSSELAGGPSGTRNDAALLANAFANVAAGQLEQTLVADLGLPLDYLAIRPGAGTDGVDVGGILSGSRVEAGKQLSERTFVTLNAGLCEVRRGSTSQLLGATIEYRLSRRFTFEASVEPLVRECRELGPNAPQYSRYQMGFDLSWLVGVP